MTENLRFCFNINITEDIFFSGKKSCHPFTRSDAICTEDNIRAQFNGITSYIDASNVYGSDGETADKLRAKANGTKGEMLTHELGPMIPSRQQARFSSSDPHNNPEDLVAGDTRAIEQPGLASMHSLFLNEHKRLSE